jgi:uncharacterized radical SAM superfamily Fe-S cluster-containing enzyme
LAQLYLARNACCGPGGCVEQEDATAQEPALVSLGSRQKLADDFFAKAIEKELGSKQLLRITITSFLDAYNFDVRRVMKCCTHHVLPSGHIIPFCAFNVLYRNGHVPLPNLNQR